MKDTLRRVSFWETAPMFRLLLPLAAGILCYDLAGGHCSGTFFIPGFCIVLPVFVVLSIGSLYSSRLSTTQFIATQVLCGLIGYGLCLHHDTRNRPDDLGHTIGKYPLYTGVLAEDPVIRKHSIQLYVTLLSGISGQSRSLPVSGKAIVCVYPNDLHQQWQKEDTLVVPGNWEPVISRSNPFGFDYAGYCHRRQLYYQQLLMPEAVTLWPATGTRQAALTTQVHRYCISSLERYIKDSSCCGLLKAMLAGDESGIDAGLRQAYADTGIIHVVSISGSHVNFLFLIIAFMLRPLPRKYQWLSFLLGGTLIWFYVLMAGASAPAIRAALMFSIVAFGGLLGRSANPFNEWCTAAFLMLLYEPMWLFAPGFQLSFTAILSIIIFYRPVKALWQPKQRILKWIADGLAVSIAAELLIAPLVAYYFHNFPLMFLAANLLACLAMMLLMVLGCLLILLSGIPSAAAMIATLITGVAFLFHRAIFALQGLSLPSLQTIVLHPLMLCLVYCFISGSAWFLLRRQKTGLWIALAAVLAGTICQLQQAWHHSRQKILIVYNHSGSHAVEWIRGQTFFYSGEGYYEPNRESALAHSGYHCRRGQPLTQHFFIINHKKILLSDSNDHYQTPMPANIVILNSWSNRCSMSDLIGNTRPEELVLSGQVSKKAARYWAAACNRAGIRLYDVRQKGAYVLEQE